MLNESPFPASIPNLGQTIGAIASGYLATRYGFKKTLLMDYIYLTLGFALSALSQGNFVVLVISRFLQGLGIVSSVNLVRKSQVTRKKIEDFEVCHFLGLDGRY